MKVIRTERGWPGHYILANECVFRRNTLLQYGVIRIVVSTVGCRREGKDLSVKTVGPDRYYETMAFHAVKEHDLYWETDVTRQVSFSSPWGINTCEIDTSGLADKMHETVVTEITERLTKGEIFDAKAFEEEEKED